MLFYMKKKIIIINLKVKVNELILDLNRKALNAFKKQNISNIYFQFKIKKLYLEFFFFFFFNGLRIDLNLTNEYYLETYPASLIHYQFNL